jgi:hypothetical protein
VRNENGRKTPQLFSTFTFKYENENKKGKARHKNKCGLTNIENFENESI